ncbi:HPr kinase/phosphorylase [Alkalibaculum sp. M08DMB]|uniref:HPr kinase/phosphorylase n=1 Tax=Alkalibaculum sporogenes TaxID=2655001 RepID=A0A6A7KB42_9FIRM|nr:HPr(Ser) kinase/phosphatase [Alkalibaculum sporogenes]MPW26565.1 HPr kinase/phosphorylase [Alkalibaculum sporogenes]
MSISLKEFCENLSLEILYDGGHEEIAITNSSINRPGLQLYGFYEYFDYDRVQIIGKVEHSYLMHFPDVKRRDKVDKFFSYSFPCAIIAWNIDAEYMIEAAKKHDRILLRSNIETTKIMYKTIHFLDDYLAPTVSIHGVLVDVFGIGVLITGSSGVGKSETALELVKRGHRLISDDVVQIKRTGDNRLTGTAPELLKQYMEIRGIGIIDVRTLYGIGAVKESIDIDMCIHLEHYEVGTYYDRLGLDNEYFDVLNIDLTKITIPVTPGRNLAIIIETAARNNRQKVMGINSAKEFVDKVYKSTNK